jgi:hypothetical protein
VEKTTHVHGEKSESRVPGDVAVSDVPPMRDLAFSILSLLIDAAASNLRVEVAGAVATGGVELSATPAGMREARSAIDAANALLASVRECMEMDAVRAVESMLTQLQIEYVRHAGRTS